MHSLLPADTVQLTVRNLSQPSLDVTCSCLAFGIPLLPVLSIHILNNDALDAAIINAVYSDGIAVWMRAGPVKALNAAHTAWEVHFLRPGELALSHIGGTTLDCAYSREC